ncbi:hypothetical protein SDC9_157097 [bioreactor metagenome]|uniref:Uncharacterized protein n=1 Tax=bioreactor metagenome TaxID=1076179 RepID=A0A645F623_9ZZZZ
MQRGHAHITARIGHHGIAQMGTIALACELTAGRGAREVIAQGVGQLHGHDQGLVVLVRVIGEGAL